VHIAKCAMWQNAEVIERITLRELAGLQRSPSAHHVFSELVERHGYPRITGNVPDDIVSARIRNPIWTNVVKRILVDGNARRILMDYTRAEYARLGSWRGLTMPE
jgi:hypothetical protein